MTLNTKQNDNSDKCKMGKMIIENENGKTSKIKRNEKANKTEGTQFKCLFTQRCEPNE